MIVRYNGTDYVCAKATMGFDFILLEDVQIGEGIARRVIFQDVRARTEFKIIDGEWSYPGATTEQQVESHSKEISNINNLIGILAGEG